MNNLTHSVSGFLRNSAFKDRNFKILCVSQFLSLVGDQFYLVAIPLQLLAVSHNVRILGIFFSASLIPRIILMFLGGAISDVIRPKKAIIISDLARGGLLLCLMWAARSHDPSIIMFLVIGLGLGIMGSLFDPAISSIVPYITTVDRLPNANGIFQASRQLAIVIGPLLGGTAYAYLKGPSNVYLFDACTYFISVLGALLLSNSVFTNYEKSIRDNQYSSLLDNIVRFARLFPETIANISDKNSFFILLIIASLVNVALIAILQMGFPILATSLGGSRASNLGLIFSCFGIGMVVSSLLSSLVHRLKWKEAIITVSSVISTISLLILRNFNFGIELLLIAVFGAGISLINVFLINELQKVIPIQLMGKGMSLLMTITTITQLLSLVMGVVIDGLNKLLLSSSAVLGAVVLIMISYMYIHRTSRPNGRAKK